MNILKKKSCAATAVKNASAANSVEVYVICQHLTPQETKNSTRHFFKKKLDRLDDRIAGQPAFLNPQSAFTYSRFIGEQHVILKAVAPESAIEGHATQLAIKKGYLTPTNVEGCFLSAPQHDIYHPNPWFSTADAIT